MAMTEADVVALLQAERNNAMGAANSSTLTTERTRAMDYYNGVMSDMTAPDGRSSAVSTDVADVVEGLMPSLMDIFASADDVVRFEPVGPEDEAAAEQETDYVNHVFMQKNPGFLVLYSFIKDALLSKVGVVKVFWDESEREVRETYLNQSDEVFTAIMAEPDIEVVEHSERVDEATGMPLHDVTVVTVRKECKAAVVPVPPEEFLISRKARNVRDASYCAHRVISTEADLIAQGYDADAVKALPDAGESENQEEQTRNTVESWVTKGDTVNRSTRSIEVVEHYVRMDYEGDGVTRLYRVVTAGTEGQLLTRDGEPDIEPIDEMPFAAMTPVIVTHRFWGRSIADLVIDIQRIKTALLRALLDNAYLANNNRMIVYESGASERTLDDLLANRPGGIIRARTPGAIEPVPNNPIGNFVFPLIEYADANKEFRTGVSRTGMGLNPDVLQNQTATAVSQQFTAAQAKMKLIARIFAETGIRDMFQLLHSTIRKNEKQENIVKLRNKWVPVNPREWRHRNDMTITVGLGSGSKAEQTAYLMNLLNIQQQAITVPQLGLVQPANIYNTLKRLVELGDLKTVEPYFTDPAQNPAVNQPPPPDPKVMAIQMKAQIDAQKAQQVAMLEQQRAIRSAEVEAMQAKADIEVERQKALFEMELARQKFEFDKQLKVMDLQAKQAERAMAAQEKAEQAATPSAAIEVRHGAEEIAGPLQQVVGAMGQQIAAQIGETQAMNAQALMAVADALNRPKQIIKDENGRPIGVAPVEG